MDSKSPIVQRLDEVQKRLATLLKPLGFTRKGRTFRRPTEPGMFQIVALQTGAFEIGPPPPEPFKHFREDHYGKFTVNVGVFVEEIFERSNSPISPKRVIADGHCSIRTRLSHITAGQDLWWSLIDDRDELADDIGALLLHVGIPFLDRFRTRDQIVRDWIRFNETEFAITAVARLDVAMVLLRKGDFQGAKRLFQEHLGTCGPKQMHHASYVRELGVGLGFGNLE